MGKITIHSKSQPLKGDDNLLIQKLDKVYKQSVLSKESMLLLSHLPSVQIGNEKRTSGRTIHIPSKSSANSFDHAHTISDWDSPIINWLAGTIGVLLVIFTFFLYQSISPPHKGGADGKKEVDSLAILQQELSYIHKLDKVKESKKIRLYYKGSSSFTYQLIYLEKEKGTWVVKKSKKESVSNSMSISLQEKVPLYIETCTTTGPKEVCQIEELHVEDNGWEIEIE